MTHNDKIIITPDNAEFILKIGEDTYVLTKPVPPCDAVVFKGFSHTTIITEPADVYEVKTSIDFTISPNVTLFITDIRDKYLTAKDPLEVHRRDLAYKWDRFFERTKDCTFTSGSVKLGK